MARARGIAEAWLSEQGVGGEISEFLFAEKIIALTLSHADGSTSAYFLTVKNWQVETVSHFKDR